MSNGIDQLNKMRSKSARPNGTRTMPPPRHQPRTTPVNLTNGSTAQDEPSTPPITEPASLVPPAVAPVTDDQVAPVQIPPVAAGGGGVVQPKKTQPQQIPQGSPKQAPTSDTAQEPEELTKSTIYLDDASDQFLEEAIYLGRKQKPRIDSRSAIVRFALRALSESMTPSQVIDAIRAAAPPPGNQGRPRL